MYLMNTEIALMSLFIRLSKYIKIKSFHQISGCKYESQSHYWTLLIKRVILCKAFWFGDDIISKVAIDS